MIASLRSAGFSEAQCSAFLHSFLFLFLCAPYDYYRCSILCDFCLPIMFRRTSPYGNAIRNGSGFLRPLCIPPFSGMALEGSFAFSILRAMRIVGWDSLIVVIYTFVLKQDSSAPRSFSALISSLVSDHFKHFVEYNLVMIKLLLEQL